MPAARRRQEEPDDDLDRGAHQEQGGGSSWSDDQLGDEGADALKNERGDSKRPPAGLTFSLLAAQVEEHDSCGGKRDAQVGGRPDALMKVRMASAAVRAGLRAVIGETVPSGPRRIASVVTPKVTAMRQARPKAGNNSDVAGGCSTR